MVPIDTSRFLDKPRLAHAPPTMRVSNYHFDLKRLISLGAIKNSSQAPGRDLSGGNRLQTCLEAAKAGTSP